MKISVHRVDGTKLVRLSILATFCFVFAMHQLSIPGREGEARFALTVTLTLFAALVQLVIWSRE